MLRHDGRELLMFALLGYSYGNLDDMREMILHPNTALGLSDGGAHCGVICDASIPTFMLTHWTRDRSRGERLPLELVVQKMTRDTARLYGLGDRGVLAPGYRADLNLIDYDRLDLELPELVFDLPGGARRLIQRADGYVATFVSGDPDDGRGRGDRRPSRSPDPRRPLMPAGHPGDYSLEALQAREEIGDVIKRLARGTDRLDEQLMASCYHPDGFDDHNSFRGSGTEFAAWVCQVLPHFAATMHFIGSPYIRLDGDVADVDTYCVAHHIERRGTDGRQQDMILGLRYVDRFERRDGRWLIAKRVCAFDWTYKVPFDPEAQFAFEPDFTVGARDRSDITYTGV